jgi:hypothetical protein
MADERSPTRSTLAPTTFQSTRVHGESKGGQDSSAPIVLAVLSLVSLALVFSFAYSWLGYWLILLTVLWCLIDPYLFAVLVLPGTTVYADAPLFAGSTWSVLRLVLVIVVLGMVLRPEPLRAGYRAMPRYLLWTMLLLLLAYSLSALANNWPRDSLERMVSHVMRVGLVAVVFVSVYRFENARYLLIGMTLQGVSMAIAGGYVWQTQGTYMAFRSIERAVLSNDSLLLFSVYAVSYASLAVSSGIASISLGMMTRRRLVRFLAYLGGAMLMLASIMSTRRQAVVAILTAVPLMLWLERNRRGLIFFSIRAILALLLNYAGYFDQFFSQRQSILEELAGRGTGRLELIRYGLEQWSESVVWGYGPGSQPQIYGETYRYSHSTVVSALLEGGLLAALLLVYLLLRASLDVFRTARRLRANPDDSWPVIFLASFANILVFAVVSGDLLAANNYLILLAIVLAYCKKATETRPDAGCSSDRRIAL